MVKIFGNFFAIFVCVYFGIDMFRKLTNKERWGVTKTALYAAMVAVISIIILSIIVILF